MSIRLLVSICESYRFKPGTHDVKKSFVMSRSRLRRDVYLKPKGKLLKVISPLYGMPDSPMHWFKTYGNYHRNALHMKPDAIDPRLCYRNEDGTLRGTLALQVNDTLFGGDESFLAI